MTISSQHNLDEVESQRLLEKDDTLIKGKLYSYCSKKALSFQNNQNNSKFSDVILSKTFLSDLKNDLNMPFYPFEFNEYNNLQSFVDYLFEEYRLFQRDKQSDDETMLRKTDQIFQEIVSIYDVNEQTNDTVNDKEIVFILSAPRSGSTILRSMLAGHSQLHCPPELGLVYYNSLDQWIKYSFLPIEKTGVVVSLTDLLGGDVSEAIAIMKKLVEEKAPVSSAYENLLEKCHNQLFVEKTPRYAIKYDILQKINRLFPKAKYIHLVRHPFYVIDSCARNRMHRLFTPNDVNAYRFGENIWSIYNDNIIKFLTTLNVSQQYMLKYENLVMNSEQEMKQLLTFLNLQFESATLYPYDGKRLNSAGLGDPNIHTHKSIDFSLANAWKKICLPNKLKKLTFELMKMMDYCFE